MTIRLFTITSLSTGVRSAACGPLSTLLIALALTMTVTTTGCTVTIPAPNRLLRLHGMQAFEAQDLPAAEARFATAVEQNPTDWKSLYYLGLIRIQQGRPFDAQILLENALELRADHPETGDILDALAEALSRRGQLAKLHELLDHATEQYASSRDYIRKGRYLLKLGDVDGAMLAYRKSAVVAKEGDAEPFVVLADFYERIGDMTNSLTALRHAYAIDPSDQEVAERLRLHGVVPGPTAGLTPPTAK